jgi:hypothetical protein
MKYFIDTEFCETPGTIDLISIGIVAEDGREYYAINRGCNLRKAIQNGWLEDNVFIPIYREFIHGDIRNMFPESLSSLKYVFKKYGKFTPEISSDILSFIGDDNTPEFYGYYADYDWVVFCWIFGRMIDLPDHFPMYCKDLKQMMDDKGLSKKWKSENCPNPIGEHNALVDARWNKKLYETIIAEKK